MATQKLDRNSRSLVADELPAAALLASGRPPAGMRTLHEVSVAGADQPARQILPLESACLFLDLDGTLAPIEARPGDVGPDPARSALLRRVDAALDGRLAVVSGRSLAEVDRILDRSVDSVAGLHGLERRAPDGSLILPPPARGLEAARREAQDFAAAHGLLLEDKGLSVAVHYRLAPDRRAAAEAFAIRAAREHGLTLQAGKMVFELRTPGADKGDVVRAFMSEPPFHGGVPVFVGDDLTDEHGFEAVRAFGGFGVLVGDPRQTLALYTLPDSGAVLQWLERTLSSGVLSPGETHP